MDQEKFKAQYPSAVFAEEGKSVELSAEDMARLHKAIGTAAPENANTVYYHGYQVTEPPAEDAAQSEAK